jgi:hypothetical protein
MARVSINNQSIHRCQGYRWHITFQILREFASQREQVLILLLQLGHRVERDEVCVDHTLALAGAAAAAAAAAGMSARHSQHQHTISIRRRGRGRGRRGRGGRGRGGRGVAIEQLAHLRGEILRLALGTLLAAKRRLQLHYKDNGRQWKNVTLRQKLFYTSVWASVTEKPFWFTWQTR